MLKCHTCYKVLPRDAFHPSVTKHKFRRGPVCKECKRWNSRMEKYGLSRSQFDDMLVAQNYLCKICKKVDLRKVDPRRVHVDHDHATGKVRGILCRDCNLMLGNAKDNPHILKNAAKYLAA